MEPTATGPNRVAINAAQIVKDSIKTPLDIEDPPATALTKVIAPAVAMVAAMLDKAKNTTLTGGKTPAKMNSQVAGNHNPLA